MNTTRIPVLIHFYNERKGQDQGDLVWLHTVPVVGDTISLPYYDYYGQRYKVTERHLKATEDSQSESWHLYTEQVEH